MDVENDPGRRGSKREQGKTPAEEDSKSAPIKRKRERDW